MNKTLFLLSAFIVFSTTSLHSMNAPEKPGDQAQGQQEDAQDNDRREGPPAAPPAAPENQGQRPGISAEELNAARERYWQSKTQYNADLKKIQEDSATFTGYATKAAAEQTVVLGFKYIDRGVAFGVDELRKKLGLLTEEEKEIQNIKSTSQQLQDENNKTVKLANDFQEASTKTKDAERAFFESQTLFQDIASAKAACELMPGAFRNPACQKKLQELFARAGMPLDDNENN